MNQKTYDNNEWLVPSAPTPRVPKEHKRDAAFHT